MSALRSFVLLMGSGLILGGFWHGSTVSGSKDGTAQRRGQFRPARPLFHS
jgi:hypothetical protein